MERNGSPERIDHRSNAERGIDEIPTVHMGVALARWRRDATPSLAQAIKLKRFSRDGKLNNEVIESIMSEEKPNQREKINIKYAEARRFIPASVPYEKTGEYILKALEYYHRYQERQKSRNDAR